MIKAKTLIKIPTIIYGRSIAIIRILELFNAVQVHYLNMSEVLEISTIAIWRAFIKIRSKTKLLYFEYQQILKNFGNSGR